MYRAIDSCAGEQFVTKPSQTRSKRVSTEQRRQKLNIDEDGELRWLLVRWRKTKQHNYLLISSGSESFLVNDHPPLHTHTHILYNYTHSNSDIIFLFASHIHYNKGYTRTHTRTNRFPVSTNFYFGIPKSILLKRIYLI